MPCVLFPKNMLVENFQVWGVFWRKKSTIKRFSTLVHAQSWCHRASTWLIWTLIPKRFQVYPKIWPGVNSSASITLQSENIPQMSNFFPTISLPFISYVEKEKRHCTPNRAPVPPTIQRSPEKGKGEEGWSQLLQGHRWIFRSRPSLTLVKWDLSWEKCFISRFLEFHSLRQ